MVTLFHINPLTQEETKVGTFTRKIEAAQCRDMLQALCSDQENAYYFIRFKDKGQYTRQFSDSFTRVVVHMNKEIQRQILLVLS
jgi:hypothetical protein